MADLRFAPRADVNWLSGERLGEQELDWGSCG